MNVLKIFFCSAAIFVPISFRIHFLRPLGKKTAVLNKKLFLWMDENEDGYYVILLKKLKKKKG